MAEREEIALHWLTTADTIVDEVDGRMTRILTMVGDESDAIFVRPRAPAPRDRAP